MPAFSKNEGAARNGFGNFLIIFNVSSLKVSSNMRSCFLFLFRVHVRRNKNKELPN